MANQKGGVGKTTTSANLAAGLARGGLRTLLLDLDPQCNATTGFGATPALTHPLVSEAPLSEAVVETGIPNLSIIPGSRSVRDVERIAAEAGLAIRACPWWHPGLSWYVLGHSEADLPPPEFLASLAIQPLAR